MEISASAANEARSAGRLLALIRSGKATSRPKLELESSSLARHRHAKTALSPKLGPCCRRRNHRDQRRATRSVHRPQSEFRDRADRRRRRKRHPCRSRRSFATPSRRDNGRTRCGERPDEDAKRDRPRRSQVAEGRRPSARPTARDRTEPACACQPRGGKSRRTFRHARLGRFRHPRLSASGVRRPAQVENDVNLMALAEHRHYWPTVNHFLYIKAGTGIGSGILIDGAISRGARGASATSATFSSTSRKRRCVAAANLDASKRGRRGWRSLAISSQWICRAQRARHPGACPEA